MPIRNVVMAFAASAVLLASAACGGSTKPAASSEAVTTPPTAASSSSSAPSSATSTTATGDSSACTELSGTVANDVCTVHTEGPSYTIDMSFPIDYPDQSAVADLLENQRDPFVAAVEEEPAAPGQKALDIKTTTYRSGTSDAGTQSLVFEEYANLGGAHPTTSYSALNYDVGKKTAITYDTLFKADSDPVAVLDPIVSKALSTQLSGLQLDPNPIGADMYKDFALTDDAVIFFISQGQWAISAAGAQKVSVPRSEIASILT